MKTLRIIKYLFAALGIAMLAGALLLASGTRTFLSSALSAEGRVVDLERTGNGTYRPVVRYTTARGEAVEIRSDTASNPPAYDKGEAVKVWYLADQPYRARLDGRLSLWGGSLALGGMGTVFFAVGGGMALAGALRRRREADLESHGVAIETDLDQIARDPALTVNGEHPYRIVTQWQDPATAQVHVFRSDAIWFDPAKYVTQKKIRVYIAPGNPRRYVVDLSFLPRLAG